MSTRAKKKKMTNMGMVVRELGAIHEWMKDHERHDDTRFANGAKRMEELATKNDLAELGAMFVEEDPERPGSGDMVPRFATKKDMQPVLNLYRGSTFVRSFFAGGATLVITVVAVGYAVIQLLSWLRGH